MLRAAAHGSEGYIFGLTSGNGTAGFLSSASSSLVGSALSMYGKTSLFLNSVAFGYAAAGITGGVSSKIAGGNFWEGARNGVITEGLNHLLHDHPVKPNLQKANNLIDKLKEAGWDHSDKDFGSKFDLWRDKNTGEIYEAPKGGNGEYTAIEYRLNKQTGNIEHAPENLGKTLLKIGGKFLNSLGGALEGLLAAPILFGPNGQPVWEQGKSTQQVY